MPRFAGLGDLTFRAISAGAEVPSALNLRAAGWRSCPISWPSERPDPGAREVWAPAGQSLCCRDYLDSGVLTFAPQDVTPVETRRQSLSTIALAGAFVVRNRPIVAFSRSMTPLRCRI